MDQKTNSGTLIFENRVGWALLILIFLTYSCATDYQPKSFTGGYSSTKLGESIFKIHFNGNGYSNSERIEDFALLRSAEIALENDFKYFIIIDKNNSNSYSTYTTPKTNITTGNISSYNYGYGGNYNFTANSYSVGGDTYLISKPSSTNIIACFKKKPKNQTFIYDAEFISNSIRNKYNLNR